MTPAPRTHTSPASCAPTFEPTAEDIVQARILLDAQTVRDSLARCDVIIVLCSYDTRIAEYAAELFKEGLAPLLLFSGKEGANTEGRFSATEAEVFAEVVRRCGVPSEAILLEKASRNTGENVRFSRELLAVRGVQAQRVIAVQKPFMGLRVRATFQKVWPQVEVLVTSPLQNIEELAPPGMMLSEVISIMVGDFQRVLEYPKLGYQTEQHVSEQARAAFEQLKQRGYTGRLMRPAQN
jgi:uncharacterized SAM-binding protein YcdF (DUF218 family)